MNPVFADTSYYFALLNSRDIAHDESLRLSKALRQPIVTTEFVLLELANALSRSAKRIIIGKLIQQFRSNPRIEIIPATSELFMRGIELYSQRQDQQWSLTDCISFIVMQNNNLTEVLTTDHHFIQAGFVSLMSLSPRHPR